MVPKPAKELNVVGAGRKIKQNICTETLQTCRLEDPPLPSRLVNKRPLLFIITFVHINLCKVNLAGDLLAHRKFL